MRSYPIYLAWGWWIADRSFGHRPNGAQAHGALYMLIAISVLMVVTFWLDQLLAAKRRRSR